MTVEFKKVSGKGLKERFQQWYGHMQKCVAVEENYFEGTMYQELP